MKLTAFGFIAFSTFCTQCCGQDAVFVGLQKAWNGRIAEYPNIGICWNKLSWVTTPSKLREGRDDWDTLKSRPRVSYRNRLRVNQGSLALEFEYFQDDGKRRSQKLSLVNDELRSLSPSIGQGSLISKRKFLSGGGVSFDEQFAVISNYRPQMVQKIPLILEKADRFDLQDGNWGGKEALVLSEIRKNGLTRYYFDKKIAGHVLGMHSLSNDRKYEYRMEVFPAISGEQFSIEKVVIQKRLNGRVSKEILQDFLYDHSTIPNTVELQVAFKPGFFIWRTEKQDNTYAVVNEDGSLETLTTENVGNLEQRATKALGPLVSEFALNSDEG